MLSNQVYFFSKRRNKITYSLTNTRVFFAQTQIQTWGHVGSESRAMAQYTFDVVDHTNVLIGGGNNRIPIAVMNIIHDSPE